MAVGGGGCGGWWWVAVGGGGGGTRRRVAVVTAVAAAVLTTYTRATPSPQHCVLAVSIVLSSAALLKSLAEAML